MRRIFLLLVSQQRYAGIQGSVNKVNASGSRGWAWVMEMGCISYAYCTLSPPRPRPRHSRPRHPRHPPRHPPCPPPPCPPPPSRYSSTILSIFLRLYREAGGSGPGSEGGERGGVQGPARALLRWGDGGRGGRVGPGGGVLGLGCAGAGSRATQRRGAQGQARRPGRRGRVGGGVARRGRRPRRHPRRRLRDAAPQGGGGDKGGGSSATLSSSSSSASSLSSSPSSSSSLSALAGSLSLGHYLPVRHHETERTHSYQSTYGTPLSPRRKPGRPRPGGRDGRNFCIAASSSHHKASKYFTNSMEGWIVPLTLFVGGGGCGGVRARGDEEQLI